MNTKKEKAKMRLGGDTKEIIVAAFLHRFFLGR